MNKINMEIAGTRVRWYNHLEVVFWLIEIVVQPIMFYRVIVWRALETATITKMHECVQRAALIGIFSALRTPPTIALNASLHIAPVDIAGRCIAVKCTLKLKETGYPKKDTLKLSLP